MNKHTFMTRLAHMGLALAVIMQLLTSLVFVAPSLGKAGDFWYEVHEYGGLTAFAFVCLFWLTLTVRRFGTKYALLFPWFSRERLDALWIDIKAHSAALKRRRLPVYDEHSPLASATHGLGLLLLTAMTVTGTIYYFVNTGDPDAGGMVGILLFVHTTLGNVVWAYLGGHAGLAVIHHFAQNLSLTEMWSLKADQAQ